MLIRRSFAVAALSAVALTGLAATPASADETATTVDCVGLEAAAEETKADFVTAQRNYRHSLKPMRKLIREERADARAEMRQSGRKLGALDKDLRHADKAERKDLAKQARAERKDIRESARLLRSDKAVRALVREERKAARQAYKTTKQTWHDARDAWRDAKAECEAEETEPETPETDVEDGTEVEGGTDVDGGTEVGGTEA